jgi:GR25 family glycosyltransferase involved in LPS biosynthesis
LAEAKPWLTSYGYYIMQNWRESSCHFDSTGPIGCFLAHRDVWSACVARNETTWVFEEGVYSYDTPKIKDLDIQYPVMDVILGHTFMLPRSWKQKSIDKHSMGNELTSIDKIYFGTKCYRISPRFAARLLENSVRFDTHVDTFICTESIRYADEFQLARTTRNIVHAASSRKINHSIDHSLLIFCLLLLGIICSVAGSIQAMRLYRRCRQARADHA